MDDVQAPTPSTAAAPTRAQAEAPVADDAPPRSTPEALGAAGRTAPLALSAPTVSLVIPGLNESPSLRELAQRIHEAMRDREPYEIIFVDDGSTDDSWAVITELHQADPRIRGARLRRNFGKATALTAGFKKARGDIIVTMDADLQDDPADLPKFLAKIEEGLDVVVGWKTNRLDPANRKILSRIFNGTVRWATGVKLHDMNCGFKAYRRDVIRTIPVYGDLFRFIPALAADQGFRVTEVPVNHQARKHGTSRYGLERILRGSFDLLSVLFLTRYSKRPMHLFGLLGLLFLVAGFSIDGYLSVLWMQGNKIGDRPLLLLGVLMILLGIQLFSMGFLGEFMTYLNQKRTLDDDVPIRDEL